MSYEAYLQNLVAVQISMDDVNVASANLRFHLGFNFLDVAN